jgi:hypothetical protein
MPDKQANHKLGGESKAFLQLKKVYATLTNMPNQICHRKYKLVNL